ncbi:putative oxidoreductase [Pseudomonas aeruginosa]|nr:putative oxidoreductase [Pseudomonas aeruginosa]
MRWRGHEIIRQRVEKYGIACDLRHGHLHAAMKASHMGELQASYEEAVRRGMGDQVVLLDKAGVQAHLETELYCGALKNTRNMHLHPLNLCIGEARAAAGLGALIFEHSEVLDIVPRPAAGGDYPRGKDRRRSRSCLPAMSTTSSNAGSSRG